MHPKHAFFNRLAAVLVSLFLTVAVILGFVFGDTSDVADWARLLAWSLVFFFGAMCGWLVAALLMKAHRTWGTWIPRDLYYLLHGVDKGHR